VKPRHEKKASERLTEDGYEVFCPMIKSKVKWSDRWKKVTRPLINGYIFARVDEGERIAILQDPSLLNCVSWLGKPAIIRDNEIEIMQSILGEATEARMEPMSPGQKVMVTGGALTGTEGLIVRASSSEAILRLEGLRSQLVVKINPAFLEKIKCG
jgi:transcription antitermination factor NusG